jgi:ABC-2 type transport system ATP-binding protein
VASDEKTARPEAEAPPPAVVMRDVSRRFGSVTAVNSLSLEVASGSLLGVIGPSGSGKTTTIRMLIGALTPTSGEVRVLGEEPRRFGARTRERIGYMPQSFILYPDLTARENVDFVASLFGLLLFRRSGRVRDVLKTVDLWDVRSRRASDLSGGMQRRLELACALVHDPALLVLDEPTAGLDPLLRQTAWGELHRLRESGRTVIVTTQYVSEAEECDHVVLISDGRVIAQSTPEGLRREALGGDVVEIETEQVFDGTRLEGLPAVREIRQRGPRQFLAVIENAGQATPGLMQRITSEGGTVAYVREFRPSFDDVFAALVERSREEGRETGPEVNGETPSRPS